MWKLLSGLADPLGDVIQEVVIYVIPHYPHLMRIAIHSKRDTTFELRSGELLYCFLG